MEKSKTVKVWTAQADIVLDTLKQTGIYQVKRRFIVNKYGEISNLFLTAYDWFVGRYAQKIPRPPGADYTIWVYADPRMISNFGPGDNILELDVPAESILFFDQAKWTKILNLSYLPENEQDEERFRQEVARQGLTQESKAVTTHFYPLLKREIIGSWDRLFDEAPIAPIDQMGALWEIKKEWVTKATK